MQIKSKMIFHGDLEWFKMAKTLMAFVENQEFMVIGLAPAWVDTEQWIKFLNIVEKKFGDQFNSVLGKNFNHEIGKFKRFHIWDPFFQELLDKILRKKPILIDSTHYGETFNFFTFFPDFTKKFVNLKFTS